jgi:hypothetical protein
MTNEEIMKLTPEELRLEIAQAKGWGEVRKNDSGEWRQAPGYGDLADYQPDYLGVPPDSGWGGGHSEGLPNWPADIAAAWELVEEMIENGEAPGEFIMSWYEEKKWYCQSPDRHLQNYTYADTAPLAICRAYLLWKATQ